MLNDISVMLKTLGMYSFIRKNTSQTSNNRGTKPENIRQNWTLYIRNSSAVKLSDYMCKNPITHKAEIAMAIQHIHLNINLIEMKLLCQI
jgi:hypothetical protein